MNKILLLSLLLVLLSGCGAFGQLVLINSDPSTSTVESVVADPTWDYISTLPQDYQRLTIPYLRQQAFPGSQIQVGALVSDKALYTSYLSSYMSEGLQINALLTKPKTPMPSEGYPAVVFVHGYIPPNGYQTTSRYEAYVDYLASNGMVVFKIDLRGHGDSQGEAGGAYFSSNYIYDTLNAWASLGQLEFVDPERIGLWGHSMAGNVVLRSMAVMPEIPAGVIWAGAVYTYLDMREFGISDGSYQPSQNPNRGRRQELYDTVGEVSSQNQFWKLVMPTNYLQDFKGKVSLHHAVDDSVVSVEYARNLDRIFASLGLTLDYYEYSRGGHNLLSPSFEQAMRRSVDTFLGM